MPGLEERFWGKVSKGPRPDGCWLWVGAKIPAGYGSIGCGGGVQEGAHRVSWELHHGKKVPSGKMVLHRCDVRHCVNPSHLFLGDAGDNARDMVKKGRQVSGVKLHPEKAARGAQLPQTKLTDAQVRELIERRRGGESARNLAGEFGISLTHTYRLIAGERKVA